MKLQNFSRNVGLNRLRQQMGAPLISWEPGGDWEPIDIDEILKSTELVISSRDIEYADDGTLEYNGQKLIVYIRDQEEYYQPYRFHVADCTTLKNMRDEGKYDKYVIPTRTDGKFYVNSFRNDRCIEKGVKSLYVCMHCLGRLNYKGTKESFNLKAFFEMYGSQIAIKPTHIDITAPVNEYPSNWDRISLRYREKVGWKCEECGTDLGEEKGFLHVHHINGLKNESSNENLRALCIGCHVEQYQHQHMKSLPEYDQYTQWLRSKNS